MNKTEFYTLVNVPAKSNKPIAKNVNGWTDGTYNYYKHDIWYCIEPNVGLAISKGDTRKESEKIPKKSTEKIAEYKKTGEYSKMKNTFQEAIKQLEAAGKK